MSEESGCSLLPFEIWYGFRHSGVLPAGWEFQNFWGLDCLNLKDSALSLTSAGVWGVWWGCFWVGVWKTPHVFVWPSWRPLPLSLITCWDVRGAPSQSLPGLGQLHGSWKKGMSSSGWNWEVARKWKPGSKHGKLSTGAAGKILKGVHWDPFGLNYP